MVISHNISSQDFIKLCRVKNMMVFPVRPCAEIEVHGSFSRPV